MPKVDECFCCEDEFLEEQLNEDGHCTMCAESRRTFMLDGVPMGRPCCRKALSELKKRIERGEEA